MKCIIFFGSSAHLRLIQYAMGKKRGRSVTKVQVEQSNGTVEEHTTQSAVEETIFDEIHRKQFFLAEDAPICKGDLREASGYQALTQMARNILNGTYSYPMGFDEATKTLCQACTRIRGIVPSDSVSLVVQHHEWAQQWGHTKEDTSLLESGLHFGHYRASAQSPLAAHLHSLKALVVMKHGVVLDR